MIMQAIQVLQLLKGFKDLVDSDDQNLQGDHVESMVKGLGSEMEGMFNEAIKEDVSQTFTDLQSYLKG